MVCILEVRNVYEVVGNPEGKISLGDLGVDGFKINTSEGLD
jgi:hypothetical protein